MAYFRIGMTLKIRCDLFDQVIDYCYQSFRMWENSKTYFLGEEGGMLLGIDPGRIFLNIKNLSNLWSLEKKNGYYQTCRSQNNFTLSRREFDKTYGSRDEFRLKENWLHSLRVSVAPDPMNWLGSSSNSNHVVVVKVAHYEDFSTDQSIEQHHSLSETTFWPLTPPWSNWILLRTLDRQFQCPTQLQLSPLSNIGAINQTKNVVEINVWMNMAII